MVTEARKQSFNAWYEKNKEAYNESRRKKYKEDPAIREKYLTRQKSYRSKNPYASKVSVREVDGADVEVFRIGMVAKYVGRSVDVIRQWEKLGIIPTPSVVGEAHRQYTKNQIALLKELAELIDVFNDYSEVKGRKAKKDNREALKLAVVKKSSEIHLNWEN